MLRFWITFAQLGLGAFTLICYVYLRITHALPYVTPHTFSWVAFGHTLALLASFGTQLVRLRFVTRSTVAYVVAHPWVLGFCLPLVPHTHALGFVPWFFGLPCVGLPLVVPGLLPRTLVTRLLPYRLHTLRCDLVAPLLQLDYARAHLRDLCSYLRCVVAFDYVALLRLRYARLVARCIPWILFWVPFTALLPFDWIGLRLLPLPRTPCYTLITLITYDLLRLIVGLGYTHP